jgi:flagellar hook-associated protein 1 FlgK
MSGLLGTLDMGNQALQAQMKGLNVTSHNLANVNNPNYSRQRVELTSTYQVQAGVDPRGTGVGVVSVQQIRDLVLDAQIRSDRSVTGYLESQVVGLEYIQAGMGSVLDSFGHDGNGSGGADGMTALLTNMSNSLQEVANDPASRISRFKFLDAADALADQFRDMDAKINGLESNWDKELTSKVDATNHALDQLASLNKSIQKAERGGAYTANDLRDQRTRTLEELSELMPIEVNTDVTGRLQVQSQGVSIIDGETVVSRLDAVDQGQGGLTLTWQTGGEAFSPSEGRLGGILSLRDDVLTNFRSEINVMAGEMIQTFNQIHAGGFAMDGSTGRDLFVGQDASSIQINPDILKNPDLLQVSSRQGEAGNNENVSLLIDEMRSPRAGLNQRTFIEAHADLVASFGQSLQTSRSDLENQQSLVSVLELQRDSISGVSLDEEMTELVKYQRAFEASARLVNIVDDMLSTVVSLGS